MRAKGRNRGRFAALHGLKKLTPAPGSPYPLLIIDATGLPVFFLCEWYRRRVEMDPGRTSDTYLDMLLPWAGFLLARDYRWNEPPDRLRTYLIEFFREEVKCLVSPDNQREEGSFVETTGASPLSKSSLGVLLAALTSLYDILLAAGYYPYPNPLRSERLLALKREHVRQVENAGAPDQAGIRGESWQETYRAFPTNQFRQRRGKIWEPEVVLEPDAVQERIRMTIDFMVQHAPFQRDQIILLLLRQTGARLSEVIEMTAGGYRSARRAGRALVKNKGSRGREEKTIYFTPTLERHVQQYIRTERATYDPHGRKSLHELDDRDPLFLTRTGKPYSRSAFYHHWRRLFSPAQRQFEHQQRVEFTPHDLRHVRVTRTVSQIRTEARGDAAREAALLEGFQQLMGWRSRETMAIYTKTMNKRRALEILLADEERLERDHGNGQASVRRMDGAIPQPAKEALHRTTPDDQEFRWYEEDD